MLDMRKVSDKQWDKVFGRDKGKINSKFDNPTGRSATIDDWEQEAKRVGLQGGHSETSLGKIYKDLDLPNLQPWSDEVRRSTAEQVKTSVLAQAMETEKAGLRVGKPGYERGVKRGTDIPYEKDQDLNIEDLAIEDLDAEEAKLMLMFDELPTALYTLDGHVFKDDKVFNPFGQQIIGPNAKEVFKENNWYTTSEIKKMIDEGQVPADTLHNIQDLQGIETPKGWGGIDEPGAPGIDPIGMKPFKSPKISAIEQQMIDTLTNIPGKKLEFASKVDALKEKLNKVLHPEKSTTTEVPIGPGSSIKVKLKPSSKIPL
jgi:hypothetical protein